MLQNSTLSCLPLEVQSFIFLNVPTSSYNVVSLVCKGLFQLYQTAFSKITLEFSQSLRSSELADRARLIILRNSQHMTLENKLPFIQAITNPHLRFKQYLSIHSEYSEALRLAEEYIKTIQDEDERNIALFQLFKTSRKVEHFYQALPKATSKCSNINLDLKVLKAGLNIFHNDEKLVKEISDKVQEISSICVSFSYASNDDVLDPRVRLIVKCARLSLFPEKHISMASEISGSLIFENICEIILGCYSDSLNDIKKQNYLILEKCIDDQEIIPNRIQEVIKKAIPRDIEFAKWLASKLKSDNSRCTAYLSILDHTRKIEDLQIIKTLKPKFQASQFLKVVNIALEIAGGVVVAREIAKLIGELSDSDALYTQLKAYLNIYKSSKDSDDLRLANDCSTSIVCSRERIKSLKKLYRITQNKDYIDTAVCYFNTLNMNNRHREAISITKLTNNLDYFEFTRHESINMKLDSFLQMKVLNFYIHYRNDYETALKLINLLLKIPVSDNSFLSIIHGNQTNYQNLKKPIFSLALTSENVEFYEKCKILLKKSTEVDELFLLFSNRLIAQKKFDEVQKLDVLTSELNTKLASAPGLNR